jgi:hypothetical protein
MKAGFIVKHNMRDISFSSVQSMKVPVHKIHLPQELHFAYVSYETRTPRAGYCCHHHNGPDVLFPTTHVCVSVWKGR